MRAAGQADAAAFRTCRRLCLRWTATPSGQVAGKKLYHGKHGVQTGGHGQTISQPYMVAVMTQALALRGGERVLEIGTGSGYQAAILGELAGEVTTIERHPELAEAARVRLASL